LLVTDGTQVFPSLAVEALRVAQGATGLITRADETGKGGALNGIRVGSFSVPVTETGEFWVYYDWNRPERYVSVADLLDPQKRPKVQPLIDGQIIFIGTSAAGLFDIRSTPLGEQVPGVSIHAQAAEQIISGNFLSRPDWAEGAEIIAVLLAGLVLVALLPLTGGLITGAAAVCLTVLMFGGSLLLFVQNGLLIDGLYPSITAFVVFAIGTSMLYVMTDREKRFVRQAFSQYLSPELVSQLEQQPDQLVLGGELRPMTILFMDVRGFTPISEQLTPTELVHFLNTLLSPLSDAIQAHGGTIDKYIGDSIMAFWNAPVRVENHAAMACAASLKMLDVVDQLNAEDAFGFKARNFKTQTVQIGIGLNTGEACVGNMGSSRRFNYSVIGDAVNVASRIESSCKSVGADLVVSEDTRTQAPDLAYLEAGAIPLKGKSRPVKLFALIGDQELRRSEAFRTLELHHMKLMDALDNRKPEAAAAALADCRNAAPPELTAFYHRLAERAEQLETAAA
ncbi:MAG: adenylate/guanylate cyclase domain-containing protein, partial [Pannonibacter phragmitetus]